MKVKRENLIGLGVVFLIIIAVSSLTAVYGEKLANFLYDFTVPIVANAVENAKSPAELFVFFFGTMMGLIVLIGFPVGLLFSWAMKSDESLDEWYQRTTGRKKTSN